MNHLTLARYQALLKREPPTPRIAKPERDAIDRPAPRRRSLNDAAHKLPRR